MTQVISSRRSADIHGVYTNTSIVWVCIAVFNRSDYTRKCLDLLLKQTYARVRTVVVDDGSTDDTSAMIRREHPEVVLLSGNGSLYWTGAMHLGIAHIVAHAAPNDYVLFLNDDLVFAPELVEMLLETARRHPQSLVQAVESCVDTPDLIWQGGVKMNWWTAKHWRLNHLRRISDFPSGHCEHSDYLTGRGVLVPVHVFKVIGNYDTRLTQYGDGEFTRRAARNGFDLIVSYDVSVLSYEKGKNFNEAESYSIRDVKRYYFGILSSARVSTRWKQAMSMTTSTGQALVFFAFDLARITVHFVKRLKLRSLPPMTPSCQTASRTSCTED
jgi:GT2 family glycosyltransferase